MNRKKALQALGIFFLVMCLLTVFSRSVDSFRVAQVTTSPIKKMVIDHSISGTGNVESTKQQAVFTVAQMKITSINVQEGDQVEAGDLLFQVDMKTLKKTRASIEAEMEQARLTQEDARQQNQLAQEKQDSDLAHAQESYDQAVALADLEVAQAQEDLDLAQEELNEFYDASADGLSAEEGAGQDEQSLAEQVREKEKALETAVANREQSVLAARQAVEAASLPAQTDSSAQIQEVIIRQKQADLDEVDALVNQEGKVLAPSSGTVSKINVSAGGQTTEEAVLLIGQESENYQLTASIDASQEEYAQAGAEVELTDQEGKKLKEKGTVKSVNHQKEGGMSVVISVPSSQVEIGESLDFQITKESQVYDCCLPLTALYENDSDYFVYVVEEEDSVLGNVQTVRQVPVEVEEKNETTVALKSGTLTNEQKIVVSTDKAIQGGSRVRLAKS